MLVGRRTAPGHRLTSRRVDPSRFGRVPRARPVLWPARVSGADPRLVPARRRQPTHQTSPDRTDTKASPVANIKSQIKRNKQNEKRHQRNKAVKSGLKTAVRKFREAAEAGDKDARRRAGRDAATKLDKAASKGVIHKNQAANRKSAIAKKAASL